MASPNCWTVINSYSSAFVNMIDISSLCTKLVRQPQKTHLFASIIVDSFPPNPAQIISLLVICPLVCPTRTGGSIFRPDQPRWSGDTRYLIHGSWRMHQLPRPSRVGVRPMPSRTLTSFFEHVRLPLPPPAALRLHYCTPPLTALAKRHASSS